MSEQSVSPEPIDPGSSWASRRRRGIAGWGDPRGRRLGGWAFILNRLTGLGVLLYLSFHLVVLSLLARGPSAWDGFVSLAGSPIFLCFDVVLIFGLLFHGLNGIRVTLVGFGLVVDRQRAMLVALMVIGAIALVVAALHIFAAG
ncbi:MAG: succinate dehydrogenase, cytochrome b556 subunit [Candidatus Limnocylindrales bacterium]|jgi:succinate dehydrogenase / fumarate reductase cytochrome b subunit